MLGRLCPLMLILLLSFAAQADEITLDFQRGKVRIEGQQLVVDFGSETLTLSNLWLIDKKGKPVLANGPIHDGSQFLIGDSADKVSGDPLFLLSGAKRGVPLPHVTVARYATSAGEHFLVWAFNDMDFLPAAGGKGLFMVQPIAKKSGRDWEVGTINVRTVNPKLRYAGEDHYTNQIAIWKTGLGNLETFRFAAYDDRSGRAAFFVIQAEEMRPSSGLAPVILPWRIKAGEPLNNQATFKLSERTDTLTVEYREPSGGSQTIPLGLLSSYSPNERQEDSPTGRKSADRMVWASGPDDILSYLKQKARYPKSMDLENSLTPWIVNSMESLIPIQAPGRTRLLAITMPALTVDQQPELSQEATLQVAEILGKQVNLSSPPPGVTYIKISSPWFAHEEFSQLLSAEISARQQVTQGRARHHFLILDVRVLGRRQGDDGNLLNLMQSLVETTATINGFNTHLVLLGRKEFLTGFQEHLKSAPKKPVETRTLSIDDSFSEDFKLELIGQLLPHYFHGTQPTPDQLRQLVDRMKEDTGKVLSDLDQFLLRLGSILEARQPDLSQATAVNDVAGLYRKLSGDRRPPRFPAEVIDNAERLQLSLSATSDLNAGAEHGQVFVDRDEILKSLENEITTWMHYSSQHDVPGLIFTFMGDKGTGKTTLAQALPGALKSARMETVKVSDLEKTFNEARGQYGYWLTPEAHLLMTLQAAADRLILDPNPVKVLFIDEAHVNPELFKTFLATADRADASGNRALNLDGLIVIIGMNVDKSNANYEKLCNAEFGKGEYATQVSELFQATLVGQPKNALSKEVAGPVASRIPKMYFFKPLSQSKEEQEKLIREEVRGFADRHHCQIILPDGSREALLKTIQNHKGGNYRSVGEKLDFVMASAITRFERGSPDQQLESGIFILSHLHGDDFIIEDAKTPENSRFVIQESYRQYTQAVRIELQREIGAMKQHLQQPLQESDRDSARDILSTYEKILEAFTAAAQQPLFVPDTNGDFKIALGGIDSFPHPESQQPVAIDMLHKMVAEIYPREPGRYTPPASDPHRVARLVAYTLAMIRQLEKLSQQSEDQTLAGSVYFGPPSAWLITRGELFLQWKTGNEKEDRRRIEAEFMKAMLLEWKTLSVKLEQTALVADKTKLTIEQGRKFQTDLDQLDAEKVDKAILERFIATLIAPGGLEAAQTMLSKREKPDTALAATGAPQMMTQDLVRISAGFAADHFARVAANEQLSATRLNTLTTVDGHPAHGPKPCRTTWQVMGEEAGTTIEQVFAKKGWN